MHPYEWGILGVKVIALGWLSDERFPRDHRHQPAASLANKIAGARKLLASAANAELHQLACVVPGDALSIQGEPVHQLARSWLQYRLMRASVQRASNSKLPIKLFRLGCPE